MATEKSLQLQNKVDILSENVPGFYSEGSKTETELLNKREVKRKTRDQDSQVVIWLMESNPKFLHQWQNIFHDIKWSKNSRSAMRREMELALRTSSHNQLWDETTSVNNAYVTYLVPVYYFNGHSGKLAEYVSR